MAQLKIKNDTANTEMASGPSHKVSAGNIRGNVRQITENGVEIASRRAHVEVKESPLSNTMVNARSRHERLKSAAEGVAKVTSVVAILAGLIQFASVTTAGEVLFPWLFPLIWAALIPIVAVASLDLLIGESS